MRFLFFISIFLYGLYSYIPAQAQIIADTLQLGEVKVQASRIYVEEQYQPVTISRLDSSQIRMFSTGNLSAALESFAPVHVRTNGPGGLATFSQRGYSPSQTQVLWNGFQLNHAMLGLTDLSLIPSFAVDQISVASGSGNTSFGDKGGGTVALDIRKPGNQLGISHTAGSFGQMISEAYAGVQAGNWSVGIVAGNEDSENDFSYTTREFSNEAGGFVEVEKKRKNNRLQSQTGIISVGWNEKNRRFQSVLWLHDMSNEIPGGINGLSPRARQDDAFLRWMSSYSTKIRGHRITSKLYLNRQQLDYFNPSTDLNSKSTSSSVIGDVEMKSSLHRRLQLVSALQLSKNWVKASEYSGSPSRSQFTAQVNPVWHIFNPVHLYGGFRVDYYSDFGSAYAGNIGINVELLENLLFWKGQVSRNFIAPTFNDLYWPELGDPNLDPETNLKAETGLMVQKNWEKLRNETEMTLYAGRVYDGIRWLPGEGGQSRPVNLEELELWGFELKESVSVQVNEFSIRLRGMLLHSLAEISKARFKGDRAVGKQLRYTPKWQVKTSAALGWKNLQTLFTYNFTDERFSTADHSSPFDPIQAFKIANWTTSWNQEWRRFRFIPQLTMQNLFDEEYAVVRDYPMPGRSYQITLTIQYKLK
ncbi:TonB-dependent receptor plug domain-containing protein [Gracilimonas mengyeensis]|uniref:Outer membrane cobalamin receptor protein n=1 Tax=Gracilimonas mengyeensis TaxID=1302730 RepID=A0A521F252_9BACT|nr:TonB-dependent receptor plug domain-containing protein [Gracilimonas mengyeensis]SMO90187.1 Outer membrane cobalamin receptor protein [Gracilimonas mengyeensis]